MICQDVLVTEIVDDALTEREQRIDHIRRAAIPVFAEQGFRRTSMADLAAAAGVSRPALYQYFDNRSDVFRAALTAVFSDAADASLAALERPGDAAARLDGFLQRGSGDLYEALAEAGAGTELMEVKHEFAHDVFVDAHQRGVAGLKRYLASEGCSGAAATAVMELITLAPIGLRSDQPTVRVFRKRLRSLADAAAQLLASS